MRRFLLPAFALLAITFAGCDTLNSRDHRMLERHDVSQALTTKMEHHEPLTLSEIIELSHRGVPGPFIVHYLRPTYFVYKLSPDEVALLKQSGVEEGVVRYLLATPTMFSPDRQPVWIEDDPLYSGSHKDREYWRY